MKVNELVEALKKVDPDKVLVIQLGHGNGYFTLHDAHLQVEGHISHFGPVLHLSTQVTGETEKVEGT